MKAIILTAIALLSIAPVFGAECSYVNETGDRLTFLKDGSSVSISEAKGDALQCTWATTPDGPDAQDIVCSNGVSSGFVWVSKEPNANARDILVFNEAAWYADCPL